MDLRWAKKPLLSDLKYTIIHIGEHSVDKDLYIEYLLNYCDYIEKLSEAEKDIQSYD